MSEWKPIFCKCTSIYSYKNEKYIFAQDVFLWQTFLKLQIIDFLWCNNSLKMKSSHYYVRFFSLTKICIIFRFRSFQIGLKWLFYSPWKWQMALVGVDTTTSARISSKDPQTHLDVFLFAYQDLRATMPVENRFLYTKLFALLLVYGFQIHFPSIYPKFQSKSTWTTTQVQRFKLFSLW